MVDGITYTSSELGITTNAVQSSLHDRSGRRDESRLGRVVDRGRFRIVSAERGIVGRFSRLVQPAELARGTPYARTSWQRVRLSSFGEGPAPTALRLGRYSEDGVRGVAGVTVGSKIRAPAQPIYTYHVKLALGVDTAQLLNPTLDASLAGSPIAITTPRVGSMFVQARVHGRARLAKNAHAFAGIAAEARGGSLLSTVNVGVQIRFWSTRAAEPPCFSSIVVYGVRSSSAAQVVARSQASSSSGVSPATSRKAATTIAGCSSGIICAACSASR